MKKLLREYLNDGQELDFDYSDYDLSTDGGQIYFSVINPVNPDVCVLINVTVSCDPSCIEFDWEPSGSPTYVPYGSQSVLYDTGEGDLESVDASGCVSVDEITFQDEDEQDITEEQVLEILNCSKETLDKCIKKIYSYAEDCGQEYLEDYYTDNPPDKPEYEPDYDDLFD